LKLTDEQKTKLHAIMMEKKTKMHAMMDEHHQAMDRLHEDFEKKLGGILTVDQMKKWEEKMEKHGDMKGHCPMCKGGKMCDMCKMKAKHGNRDDKKEHDHK
jgi:hypothetical protein